MDCFTLRVRNDGVAGKLHKIALFPVCSVESKMIFPDDGRDHLNSALE
jgi:hypothetical protein